MKNQHWFKKNYEIEFLIRNNYVCSRPFNYCHYSRYNWQIRSFYVSYILLTLNLQLFMICLIDNILRAYWFWITIIHNHFKLINWSKIMLNLSERPQQWNFKKKLPTNGVSLCSFQGFMEELKILLQLSWTNNHVPSLQRQKKI